MVPRAVSASVIHPLPFGVCFFACLHFPIPCLYETFGESEGGNLRLIVLYSVMGLIFGRLCSHVLFRLLQRGVWGEEGLLFWVRPVGRRAGPRVVLVRPQLQHHYMTAFPAPEPVVRMHAQLCKHQADSRACIC